MKNKRHKEYKLIKYILEVRKFHQLQNRYKSRLKKQKNVGVVRVGFYIVYDSVFSFEKLYLLMKEDEYFKPFIVLIPDIIHGEENKKIQLEKAFKALNTKYQDVKCAYDNTLDCYLDFSDQVDLVCIDNPYDCLTMDYYRIDYLSELGIPTFYTSYGYSTSNWHNHLLDMKEYRLLWRYFLLNQVDLEEMKRNTITRAENTRVFGYAKMDMLFDVKKIKRDSKKIIIATHHTIDLNEINYSTFLSYSEFWLELPLKYPDIEFVFRPHPLLNAQLINHKDWGEERVSGYYKRIQEIPNFEYQDGGDYFDTFVNSDAIIHDCGSFMGEYLFTEHPACFLLKDEETNKRNYNIFSRMCINQHYKAFTEKDIIKFIDEVVVKGKDEMLEDRRDFFMKNLRFCYPNVSREVLNYIKNEMGFI